MIWSDWKPFYETILKNMHINPESDLNAAHQFYDLLLETSKSKETIQLSLKRTKRILSGERFFLFGAGPNLTEHIKFLEENNHFNKEIPIVSADGASKALIEKNVIPEIIVSDLDGFMNEIIYAGRKGSIIYVHAHGDNLNLVNRWFPEIAELEFWVPTIQSDPGVFYPYIYNFGGFTDGDRALSLILHFSMKSKIILFGFEFENLVGRYSKPSYQSDTIATDFKRQKLNFAKDFIKSLSNIYSHRHKIIFFKKDLDLDAI